MKVTHCKRNVFTIFFVQVASNVTQHGGQLQLNLSPLKREQCSQTDCYSWVRIVIVNTTIATKQQEGLWYRIYYFLKCCWICSMMPHINMHGFNIELTLKARNLSNNKLLPNCKLFAKGKRKIPFQRHFVWQTHIWVSRKGWIFHSPMQQPIKFGRKMRCNVFQTS